MTVADTWEVPELSCGWEQGRDGAEGHHGVPWGPELRPFPPRGVRGSQSARDAGGTGTVAEASGVICVECLSGVTELPQGRP